MRIPVVCTVLALGVVGCHGTSSFVSGGGLSSVRTGDVPGTHEIVFGAPFEQVRLVHEARDRRVFAAGALTAARWLVGKRGVFTLDQCLGEIAR